MADENNNIERDEKQINSRYDPEKEIPDPEQVERNREQARQQYGDENSKDPAA